jgi:lipopolysaccharide assembly outer membrane protein LptD (OstA)
MKRLALCIVLLVLVMLPSLGASQQASRVNVSIFFNAPNVGVYRLGFTADSMQRQDRVITFKGNVEVRITPISTRTSPVIQANEVIYNVDTGNVEIPNFGHFSFGKAQ